MSLPSFFCVRTLLSYHLGQDLNRVNLVMPDKSEFVLYEMGEARCADANERCNRLAAKLCELWDARVNESETKHE